MQDINTTVIGVQQQPTSRGTPMFKVALGDGQSYTTFNPNIANKAYSLTGQQVTARTDTKPSRDGRFMNYTLEDIAPQGQLPPMAMPVAGGTPAYAPQPPAQQYPQAGVPQQAPAQIPQAPPQQRGGMTDEDKARISRLGASGTAFEFVGQLFAGSGPESIAEAEEFARKLTESILRHGWTGSFDVPVQAAPEQQQAPQQAPAPTTPQEVAAQVPGVQAGVQTGSEIPWTQ